LIFEFDSDLGQTHKVKPVEVFGLGYVGYTRDTTLCPGKLAKNIGQNQQGQQNDNDNFSRFYHFIT
jgi:hypothetical protein